MTHNPTDCVNHPGRPAAWLLRDGTWRCDPCREADRDTESTSAALRRAEQERDEANELCDKVAAELRLVTRERDSLARRCALRFEERDLARAELVSAQQELDAVRTARDNLGRELAEARASIRAFMEAPDDTDS